MEAVILDKIGLKRVADVRCEQKAKRNRAKTKLKIYTQVELF